MIRIKIYKRIFYLWGETIIILQTRLYNGALYRPSGTLTRNSEYYRNSFSIFRTV